MDLNVQKLPKLGKHNFLADTSEVLAGVGLIDILNVILHVAATQRHYNKRGYVNTNGDFFWT